MPASFQGSLTRSQRRVEFVTGSPTSSDCQTMKLDAQYLGLEAQAAQAFRWFLVRQSGILILVCHAADTRQLPFARTLLGADLFDLCLLVLRPDLQLASSRHARLTCDICGTGGDMSCQLIYLQTFQKPRIGCVRLRDEHEWTRWKS